MAYEIMASGGSVINGGVALKSIIIWRESNQYQASAISAAIWHQHQTSSRGMA